MVEVTIDGIKTDVPEGSMVIQAAHKLGVYVPHFCYHKKLSIAANCRMCLVDVEKAPKALPACATPVTNGMVVHTRSEKAVAAQNSVMEFLLINHPLDCPVCDQGGECQLQDLAVGYGKSASRYQEAKRVVSPKDMGPLISTDGMQRCIHCTRCVRFGEEIGGMMEIGMVNRGEFSEITTFLGKSVESELSGNVIDLCPVGALLSKPYKMSARPWELARRRTVSPHDSLGSNLIAQVKLDRVKRVVPFENDDVNECWISDRDRFSYDGLYTEDRLTHPMIRGDDGQWREASWSDALQIVVQTTNMIREEFGAEQIGALGSPMATTEELALLARLTRALGSENIDFRLRQADPAFDDVLTGVPWLGMPVTELNEVDRVVVVGSFLRKDQPLMAQRLRQAAKRGTQVYFIDSAADDPLFPVAGRITVAPSAIPNALAEIAVAVAEARGQSAAAAFSGVKVSDAARAIAGGLASGSRSVVLMGAMATSSPNASLLAANAAELARASGARFGFLVDGGNTVGGYIAEATPRNGGRNAVQMLSDPLKAYFVLHAEPSMDAANGAQALEALNKSGFAVALTAYRSAAEEWADVMLPVSPFTETSGTFVNAEGRVQSFKAAAAPLGDTRPAWKVLRVLGNFFELQGFDDESSETVRDAVIAGGIEGRLSNEIKAPAGLSTASGVGSSLERVADVPIYRTDPVVRRSIPLQETTASQSPRARMAADTLAGLGIGSGDTVRIKSAHGEIQIAAELDDTVAAGCVRIAAAFPETLALGAAAGQLNVERA